MKNLKKVRGVTPDYVNLWSDSSHQQRQQQQGSLYQKVRLGHRSGML